MKRSDAQAIIVVAVLWASAAAIFWGTWAAGSTDSYGYVSQAELWLEGDLIIDQPLARSVPWPDADWTFSPLGYRPGLAPGTIVPVYPPGLPIMMAIAQAAGGRQAVYLVVPLFAALTVLATVGLATRLSGVTGGAFGALLIAISPTFLFASMWPMSDVPATALWAIAVLLVMRAGPGSALGAGMTAGFAIMTRPNLVAVGLVPAGYLLWRSVRVKDGRWPAVWRLALFAAPAAAGCLAVAGIHSWLYGSPLSTGHGDAGELFSAAVPANNAGSIIGWLVRVEPAVALLSAVGLVFLAGREREPGARTAAALCVGLAGAVYLSYAFVVSNVDWWFVRFLLPAFPALAALGAAGLTGIGRQTSGVRRAALIGALAFLIVTVGLSEAVRRGTFGFRAAEARYEAVGAFVSRQLPPEAILFAFQESGGLRHYGGRPTIRFDLLAPEWLEPAVAHLRDRGYRPYFVIDDHEMAIFRQRFGERTPLGRLDWPPIAEWPGQVPVRIFDPLIACC